MAESKTEKYNYSRSTEIRRLCASVMNHLSKILDPQGTWQDLMGKIPKNLDIMNTLNSTPDLNYEKKYTWEDIKLLNNAKCVDNDRRSATQILFDEWGTSGRVRPNLGHLLNLLIHINNFRAADYVAQILLGEEAPERPLSGPGAAIAIPSSEDTIELNQMLDQFEYPENLPEDDTLRDNNVDDREKIGCCDFKKSAATEFESKQNMDNVLHEALNPINNNQSDMMPKWESLLLNPQTEESVQNETTNQSNSMLSSSKSSIANSFGGNRASTSQNNGNSGFIPSSLIKFSEDNIPILSILGNCITSENGEQRISLPSALYDDMPDFDALQIVQNIQISAPTTSQNEDVESEQLNNFHNSNQRTLNIYKYADLLESTENFDKKYIIGTGGYSEVYLANNLAVKKLFSDKPKYKEKFEFEIKILSKIKHKNIVQLLGFSSDGPELCLLYEYLPEGTLELKLEESRERRISFDWRTRFQILSSATDAVHFIHSEDIIHRDIKSANVLIENGNNAKLCDFGLLRMLSSDFSTEIAGTNPYMSDEMLRGNFTKKTDIFALGIMILETVTGLNVYTVDLKFYTLDYLHRNNNNTKGLLDSSAGVWKSNKDTVGNSGNELIMLALECIDDDSTLDIQDVKNKLMNMRQLYF